MLRRLIRTERLVLRPARWSDLKPLHAMMSDGQTMRYWSTPPHDTIALTRAFLENMIEAPSDSDDFIIEKDGEAIGKMGAWRLPEIGYLLARPHWGKGYATEALKAFAAYAFAHRTDHLTADVDPRNAPSLALLSRLGFHQTGRAESTFCVGGEWCDSVYLRLDRPQP
jgi:[ribosomal protein S5]-alanine N-acetyltransferase